MASVNTANSALEEFLLTVDELGLEKTRFILSTHRRDHSLQQNKDARFVIAMVAKMFRIPEKEITDGVHRNNERRDAIGFCVYYLHDVLGHAVEEVELMLTRSRWVCYKHVKKIRTLDSNNAQDKKYATWMKKMDYQVAEYKAAGLKKEKD